MPFAKYAKESATDDEGGKSEWWSEKTSSWYEGGAKAEGRSVNPLVEKLLGTKPKMAQKFRGRSLLVTRMIHGTRILRISRSEEVPQ